MVQDIIDEMINAMVNGKNSKNKNKKSFSDKGSFT